MTESKVGKTIRWNRGQKAIFYTVLSEGESSTEGYYVVSQDGSGNLNLVKESEIPYWFDWFDPPPLAVGDIVRNRDTYESHKIYGWIQTVFESAGKTRAAVRWKRGNHGVLRIDQLVRYQGDRTPEEESNVLDN